MHRLPAVIALDARPRRQDGVLAQEAQGQTVLLRLDDGSYYALDAVGAVVWELCDGRRSLADIVAAVCERFDAPSDEVQRDVLEFVADLQGEHLLAGAG